MNAEKPTDWDQLYPNRFLKAGELQGKKVTLTIATVDTEELVDDEGKKKVKGIIGFAQTPKQIPLNKTNGLCLRAMFGRKVQEWVGHKITIFAGQWNGEEAIRIWGSPELEADNEIEIKLPRRKAFNMTMHKVAVGKKEEAA